MRFPKISRRDVFSGIGALVGAGVLALLAAVIVLTTGAFNVAAVNPHGRLETMLLHFAFKRSVSVRAADIEPPEDLMSEGRILVGAQHYDNVCSKCHGGPELGQNPIALSMRPRPQHLPAVVDQFSDSEIFWILENGVKFSAMPAWPTQTREDEIWSMVAFLRQLNDMDAATYAELVAPPQAADLPPMPYEDPGPLAEADVNTNYWPQDEYLYAVPATEWPAVAKDGHPAAECASCHGVNGAGSATRGEAPNLTIQSADYIEATLQAYAQADRKSGIMQTVAAGLTGEQMRQLADYYSGLTPIRADAETASADLIERGRDLAVNGRTEDGIVPCMSCHQQGESAGELEIPQLAGQSSVYIRRQLVQFAGDGRGLTHVYNPMPYVAHAMTSEDVEALAAYFASLDPGESEEITAVRPEVDMAYAADTVANVCSECHTESGAGVESGEYPNLTLQTTTYLEKQLHLFNHSDRVATQMNNTARFLGSDNIPSLAAYFGRMEPQKLEVPIEQELIDEGAQIVQNGLPEKGVPACLTCHSGETAQAIPMIARLHGQHPAYLEERLDYYDGRDIPDGDRGNPMYGIATLMSRDEREAAAAWFAAQEPLPKPQQQASNTAQ